MGLKHPSVFFLLIAEFLDCNDKCHQTVIVHSTQGRGKFRRISNDNFYFNRKTNVCGFIIMIRREFKYILHLLYTYIIHIYIFSRENNAGTARNLNFMNSSLTAMEIGFT
jgi:hypothetical protein